MRTNCIDCLDRTNVMQGVLGRKVRAGRGVRCAGVGGVGGALCLGRANVMQGVLGRKVRERGGGVETCGWPYDPRPFHLRTSR